MNKSIYKHLTLGKTFLNNKGKKIAMKRMDWSQDYVKLEIH